MATTKATATSARANPFQVFVWEGTDKRGTKMKGQSQSKSANLVRAELRHYLHRPQCLILLHYQLSM